jgi:adenylate cyclase
MVEGIARIREGLAAARDAQPLGLGLLADACGRIGLHKEWPAVIEEVLKREFNSDRRDVTAWFYQLKGDLLLVQNDQNEVEAEDCFRESINIAQSQSNKSQELVSTAHLARLLARKNRDGARAMLSEIYNWFAEGFDTLPLKEAKALLDELSTTRVPSRRRGA